MKMHCIGLPKLNKFDVDNEINLMFSNLIFVFQFRIDNEKYIFDDRHQLS